MNSVRTALPIVLLVVCGFPLFAGEALDAVLVVPDRRILPGVPFDFWVELRNRSDAMRVVRVCAPFQMRLVAGEPIHWIETDVPAPRSAAHIPRNELVVAPGATAVLAIPAAYGLMAPDFFRDRQLSSPGRRFELTLPLCERGAAKLLTTAVEIEVVTPSGSDAAVWKRMNEGRKQPWTAADMGSPDVRPMWESVLRDFPDSNYVPYAVLMTGIWIPGSWSESLARQLRAIQRFPDSPALEWLHVEAWETARSLRLRGVMLAEGAVVRRSKRPTTRVLAFGDEAP